MMGRDYRTIMRALGFKLTDHLPPEGMPVRLIDGVPVYVKSKNGKVLERRVIAICSCGEHFTLLGLPEACRGGVG
jgi:hypothetical protein